MDSATEFRGARADRTEEEPGGMLAFDLRQIWAMVYRNRLIMIIAMAICLLLGVLYLVLATPVFTATASVQIEEQSARVLKTDELEPARNPLDAERFLKTQVDIIRSRAVALAVIREQKLANNPGFLEAMGVSGEAKSNGILNRQQAEQERLLKLLADNLVVHLPTQSRVVSISFNSPDPHISARLANSFAENYIRTDLQRKYSTSAYARQFLANQLETARVQLERSERAALAYASDKRLIDASNAATTKGEPNTPKSLTVSRLVTLNSAYANAVANRIQAQQKWEQAQGASFMNLPEVLANQAIQDLLQKRAVANAEYRDQLQTRKAEFPAVQQAKAQIQELDRQIAAISASIRNTLRSQFDVARRQEASLRSQMGGLEAATLDEQQRNVQLSILQRATDTNRSLYDSLLQRYRELSAEAGVQANNIQLVDRAVVPSKPVSPRLIVTLLLALVGGIVSGVAAAFAIEHLNDTVRSGEELDQKLGLPLLGAIPEVKGVAEELEDPKSAVSEAYNSIRAALLMSSRHGLPRSLAFTSIQPSEGKTTTAFSISKGIARVGKRVVVVDCDLRRPALHKAFEIANRAGVSEFLSGQMPIEPLVQSTEFENVSIVTCGLIPHNPTELLSGPLFGQMLNELGARFDIVIVDTPPILGLADAVLITSQVEAVVLVMQSGRNYRGALRTSVARLHRAGVNLIGALLTKQNLRNLGFSYDYKYQYSYGEKTREG